MGWHLPLSRPLEVTDRKQPLATLRDAGDYMSDNFKSVMQDEALVFTVETLIAAAQSGAPGKVDVATDHVEFYLFTQRRIRSLERAKRGPGWVASELRRRLDQAQ